MGEGKQKAAQAFGFQDDLRPREGPEREAVGEPAAFRFSPAAFIEKRRGFTVCGRYFIREDEAGEEIAAMIEAINRRGGAPGMKTAGEIRPADTVPVLANSRGLRPAAFAMTWGYTLPGGKRLINARSETAADKPVFEEGMRMRRCLIPASGYYEWARAQAGKPRYAMKSARGETLYMAGIYRLEGGRPVFAILTREPGKEVAPIHDRMPVLLPEGARGAWLDPRCPAEETLRQAETHVFCAMDSARGASVQTSFLT